MSDAAYQNNHSKHLPGMLICALFSAAVFYFFHDVFWFAPDEGAYAHVAERILNGEVLGRDVKDIHAGYANFVNAFAMALFGETLVSMRYPLIAMGIVEAVLIYLLVAPSGRMMGIAASVVFTALSTVQFLNPSANWYAFFLTILLVCILSRDRIEATGKLELLGFLLVTVFLFRQLSGVIVAIGVVSWLICKLDDNGFDRAVLGRGVLSIMMLGLAGYLWTQTEIVGFMLFGIWPLGILAFLVVTVRISDRRMWRIVLRMCVGGLLAMVPLVVYGLVHGSLAVWFHDTFIAALGVARFEFGLYSWFFGAVALNLIKFSSVREIANAFYWLAVLLAPCVIGGLVWYRLVRGREPGQVLPPLLFIAPFYGLVAITHLQSPVYLMYPSGLIMAGLIYATGKARYRYMVVAVSIFMAGMGLYYQAGQPVSLLAGRSLMAVVSGERWPPQVACPSDRCGLRIQASEKLHYEKLLGAIAQYSKPDETILVLPSNPELYFLAERQNPLPFYNSAVGIHNEAELADYSAVVRRSPPKVVIYNFEDNYNTDLTKRLWDAMRADYVLVAEYDQHQIYQLKP